MAVVIIISVLCITTFTVGRLTKRVFPNSVLGHVMDVSTILIGTILIPLCIIAPIIIVVVVPVVVIPMIMHTWRRTVKAARKTIVNRTKEM